MGTLQITEWKVDYGVGLRRPHLSGRVRAAAGARVKVNGDHLHCVKCGILSGSLKVTRKNVKRRPGFTVFFASFSF